jgi:hypothetical protein
MQKSFARLNQIFYFSLVAESLLFLFSKWIFRLWMGSSVSIPFSISLAVFVYCNLMAWLSICIYPINGIGKVKLQLYSSVAEILIIVPAALALGKCWGTPGIILAPILVSIPRAIWAPMQLNKLIKRTASGIWAK